MDDPRADPDLRASSRPARLIPCRQQWLCGSYAAPTDNHVRDLMAVAKNISAMTFGKGQLQDTGVGGEQSTVERGCDFPAGDGWQGEGDRDIVRHGGCGTGE